ncbi:hypothetical protein EU538_12175 [Candidatus Thorarchaeota archaeon]|nr:MAG: hypothetical protein EU538_12175 [Candidatus Thorarchaeota archaeon]
MFLGGRHTRPLLLLAILCCYAGFTGYAAVALPVSVDDARAGPLTDKLVFKVFDAEPDIVESLQESEIDIIADTLSSSAIETLETSESIDVSRILSDSYAYFSINCVKYPFNITAFRRAVGFALDKWALIESLDGLEGEPLDSCVPKTDPLSIEGTLDYSYYEEDLATAHTLLDDSGFVDVDEDGIREAPDGSDFDVCIEVAESSSIAVACGDFLADALQRVNIDAYSQPTGFYEYVARLSFHGDYDFAFLGGSYAGIQELAYDYMTQYTDYYNFPNFHNASWDYWAEKVLYPTGYVEMQEAAVELQKICLHEVPAVMLYERSFISVYRTDRFEEFYSTPEEGTASWWTFYRVHLRDGSGGPFGGSFNVGAFYDYGDSINMFSTASAIGHWPLLPLYDTLLKPDPVGTPTYWLLESVLAETHDDNPAVPEGHTRFNINLVENATWTDGSSLTAEDVVFSLNYYRDAPGHPFGTYVRNITSCNSVNAYSMRVEFATESYWHLESIGKVPIIPGHVFEEMPPEDWRQWNPNPPKEPMVTSGPFNVTGYVEDDYLELTANPDYFRRPAEWPSPYEFEPIITSYGDVTVSSDAIGSKLNWTVHNASDSEYFIYLNSTVSRNGSLSSDYETIFFSLDSLSIGLYNCTIEVATSYGDSISDTVWVRIEEPPDDGSGEWIGFMHPVSLAATVVGIVVIIVFGTKTLQARKK